MGGERLSRKLAAILYADVAEYSRLTGEDEDGTHLLLREFLDCISERVSEHQGNVVHYAGDAVLADFDTVTDALKCAVDIQNELESRNRDVDNSRKVRFRIGINLGEVIEDRGEIYGDGVNVAARLEGLAEPGGICVSESVRSAAGKKLDLDFEFIGEREVKNIAEPVRAYRIAGLDYDNGVAVVDSVPADSTEVGHENSNLQQRPSLVVVPFECMSEGRDLEFLADGLSEDLTTLLARVPGFLVISRSSALSYKDKRVEIGQ